jgi:hypothetical protein
VPPNSGILSAVFHGPFMKPQVEIYDTTLRDGSQGEGIIYDDAHGIVTEADLIASADEAFQAYDKAESEQPKT